MSAKEVIKSFWQAMGTNDFSSAAQLLSEDFTCFWPQSHELIEGRDNFIKINSNYPAHGEWKFKIISLIAEGDQVVSEVEVTDGVIHGRAITFHRVVAGLIKKQVEFWPDDFAAPEWRRQWVKLVGKDS